MKKLLILATVALAAVVAQSATVDWSITGASSAYASRQYYLFNATDRAAVVALFTEGTSDQKFAGIQSEVESYAVASGQLSTSRTAIGNLTVADDNTDYKYFSIVLNRGTSAAAEATKYYLSGDFVGHSYTASTSASKVVADTSTTSFSSATSIPQSSTPTPEPTSGVLMVLGAAGLALRRKRG